MSTHQATPREREIHGQRVVFASAERAAIVPPGTVDLVVTSPPYWNLKDYGHPEQIGASSYEEYPFKGTLPSQFTTVPPSPASATGTASSDWTIAVQ